MESSAPSRASTSMLTAIAPLAWGTTYAVTTELLPPERPWFSALARALPAGLAAIAVTRRLPHGDWWWKATLLGVLNMGVFFPMLFIAAAHLPGGVAATLGATQTLLVAGCAVLVLRQPPDRWRIGWGVVGVAGIALVVLGPAAALDAVGIGAGIAGALSMSLGVTLAKRWGRPPGVGPMAYAGWQLTAGGIALLPVTLALEGLPTSIDASGLVGYLWLGLIGALLAYTLWFRGIGLMPVTATALLGLLSPLMAATVGLALGESLTLLQTAGFALALLAMACGQLPAPGRGAEVQPTPPHITRKALT